MTIINSRSGTNVHEVAEDIYRINTPVATPGQPGFSFNQYLIADEEPLLFHSGPRRMFPLVSEAVASVLPVTQLRWIAFSHVEADECGSLNEWLAAAPRSEPLCGTVAAMVSVNDLADRPPRALGDGERLSLGKHTLRWFDAPHLPHAWECGFMADETTATLLCGDLFTQGGTDLPPPDRVGHPRPERVLPPADGLLLPYHPCPHPAGQAGRHRTADPGLHARQRLAGRRRRAAARTGGQPDGGPLTPDPGPP